MGDGAGGADVDSEDEGESEIDGAEDGAGQPRALAAIWADPGGGSELRRLRRMLALDVRGGGEEGDEEEEEEEEDEGN
ncbi:hypothetical protein HYH03_016170 [Edaphochlamys debaryana]|uniref:Uncharacterized protein n=1 Tax=Edaphochlamys debaryana TaxID=47281 RepID=A0A835XJ63_9CHLO|nr:hypothetical protein HYH03_016170 [Edaphochlamys debaryana]|eukprot:KAG2485073.1 hypothetical protein HYH03_016170 [Edaphochlamys debaryana]